MLKMKSGPQIKEEKISFFGFAASISLHGIIFLAAAFLLGLEGKRSKINPVYVQVITQDLSGSLNNYENSTLENIKRRKNENHNDPVIKHDKINPAGSYTYQNLDADTTALEQTYHEATLNVTIKYPAGWRYVDQDAKNKLDGVTFWAAGGNNSPPPYVHLEVKDRDIFSAARYKYKSKMGGYALYYNDPEEMEGQVMQTVYVRTDSGQDFSLKLIIDGAAEFKAFQPAFFGMIKTFRFGRSFF